jgi:hypothetical protein
LGGAQGLLTLPSEDCERNDGFEYMQVKVYDDCMAIMTISRSRALLPKGRARARNSLGEANSNYLAFVGNMVIGSMCGPQGCDHDQDGSILRSICVLTTGPRQHGRYGEKKGTPFGRIVMISCISSLTNMHQIVQLTKHGNFQQRNFVWPMTCMCQLLHRWRF